MKTNCEECVNYEYDDEFECYTCMVSLDEDEMLRFMQNSFYDCPYYRNGNEYLVVKKQN